MENSPAHSSKKGLSLSFVGDAIALIAALAVIGLSVADTLKLYDVNWYKEHQIAILLCLVSFLIIAVILERRITIQGLISKVLSEIQKIEPNELSARLGNSGLKNFYTSRADYDRYRGEGGLQAYLRGASKTIHIVAYWLSQGIELEGIARELREIIRNNHNVKVTVAVVNPISASRAALASYLDMDIDDLTARINASLQQLVRARQELDQAQRKRFEIRTYDTLPIASTIMLDVAEPSGRIQLDLKLYKTARQFSVGFEIQRSQNELYNRVEKSTLQLIRDSSILAQVIH